jgi:hypothetical protein
MQPERGHGDEPLLSRPNTVNGDPGSAVQRGGCSVVAHVLVVTFALARGAGGGVKWAVLSEEREHVVACEDAHRALDGSSAKGLEEKERNLTQSCAIFHLRPQFCKQTPQQCLPRGGAVPCRVQPEALQRLKCIQSGEPIL